MKKIIVGLPSYNEAKRIGFVTRQIDLGLKKYFNPSECLIVNLDSNSPDDTKSTFMNTPTNCRKTYISTARGKGYALIDFWKFSLSERADTMVTIDADIYSITPEWLKKLISPVKTGEYDVVAPVYTRNRFDAGVTNHFAYPLIYSLYGVKLRQPLAGEYAYSPAFARYLITQPKHTTTYKYGIDFFITASALYGRFKVLNRQLGRKLDKSAYFHQKRMFLEVTQSAIFVTKNHVINGIKKNSADFTIEGDTCGIDKIESFRHERSLPNLFKKLRKDFEEQKDDIEKYLGDLYPLARSIVYSDSLGFSADLWTDILAKVLPLCYTSSFDTKDIERVSYALLPIYRRRVIPFWLSIKGDDPRHVEDLINDQAILLAKKLKIH